MENLKKVMPLVLLCAVVIKSLVSGASFADAPFILALVALVAANEVRAYDAQIKLLKKEIEEIKATDVKQSEDIESIRTYLTTVKLSNQIRPNKLG